MTAAENSFGQRREAQIRDRHVAVFTGCLDVEHVLGTRLQPAVGHIERAGVRRQAVCDKDRAVLYTSLLPLRPSDQKSDVGLANLPLAELSFWKLPINGG